MFEPIDRGAARQFGEPLADLVDQAGTEMRRSGPPPPPDPPNPEPQPGWLPAVGSAWRSAGDRPASWTIVSGINQPDDEVEVDLSAPVVEIGNALAAHAMPGETSLWLIATHTTPNGRTMVTTGLCAPANLHAWNDEVTDPQEVLAAYVEVAALDIVHQGQARKVLELAAAALPGVDVEGPARARARALGRS